VYITIVVASTVKEESLTITTFSLAHSHLVWFIKSLSSDCQSENISDINKLTVIYTYTYSIMQILYLPEYKMTSS
jgi:hypothetical protein